jgi:hypothetical protein
MDDGSFLFLGGKKRKSPSPSGFRGSIGNHNHVRRVRYSKLVAKIILEVNQWLRFNWKTFKDIIKVRGSNPSGRDKNSLQPVSFSILLST